MSKIQEKPTKRMVKMPPQAYGRRLRVAEEPKKFYGPEHVQFLTA